MVMTEVRASQPGDAPSGARGFCSSFQSDDARRVYPAKECLVPMNLGSYNFGIDQQMLRSARTLPRVRKAMIAIAEKAVNESSIDLLFGNEVGGHRQGLPAEDLSYRDVLAPAFGEDVEAEALLNYTAAWKFGPEDPTSPVVHKKWSKCIPLDAQKGKLDPQLAMWFFEVTHKGRVGYLVVGCLHVT